MPRLLIHFARYGPYHHARLQAATKVLAPLGWQVVGLETAGNDATYAWDETRGEEAGPQVITAFPGRLHEEISSAECKRVLPPLLAELKPDAMAIAGWSAADALSCLSWCRRNDVRRIVMSETREADGRRVWWKELVKRYLISRFDGALVGAKSHRDYLVKLGMSAEKTRLGYNVVDNAFFAAETAKWQKLRTETLKTEITEEQNRRCMQIDADDQTRRNRELEVGGEDSDNSFQLSEFQLSAFSPKYFLASNRFIERKNLARLIDAYATYMRRGQGSEVRGQETGVSEQTAGNCAETSQIENHQSSIVNPSPLWNLCLLGDGELKADLIAQCKDLGLQVIEAAPWKSSVTPGSCLPPPLSSSLSPDPCPLTPDSSASHSHLAPLGTSGLAQRSGPTDPCLLTPDSSASHSHLAPMGTSGLAQRSGPTVYFPGFRQIEELPRFYAHAGCFIHPALQEPWGLVINEAMASGLPILSGDNVGAAEELVDDGVNGWKFDATDVESIAGCLGKVAALDAAQRMAMGAASAKILEERCPTEAFGRGLAEILGNNLRRRG